MTSRPAATPHGAASLGRLLGACATGRANGLSPQLVADLTALHDPSGNPARRGTLVLRVTVLRTGVAAAGLVPALTGVHLPEPPAAADVVPLAYAHQPYGEPELSLPDGRRRALDRLARLLLRDGTDDRGSRTAAADRYGTLTWLRIRAEHGRDRFFATRYRGEDAVARAWRRIQDVTVAGMALDTRAAASVPDIPDIPATLSAQFAGGPLPWPPAGDGVRLTVTDLPVPPDGALPVYALEVLDSSHLVLAAAPHPQLAGREPLPAVFPALLTRSVGGPCRPLTALVSCVSERHGADFLAGLAGWLRGTLPRTVGPFTRGLPVHVVSLPPAEDALRVLLRPADRASPALARARDDWSASGLPVLCSAALAPALRRARTAATELSTRRFRAALHDIRLDGYDVPRGAGRGPATAAEVLASGVTAEQLWDELDRFAAVPLAGRAVLRLARADGSGTSPDRDRASAGPVEPYDPADDPHDSRGAIGP